MTSRTRPGPNQLVLALDEPAGDYDRGSTVVSPTVSSIESSSAMVPGHGSAPFDDPAWFFEPWWPGVPATLTVDGPHLRLVAGQFTDPLPAFPELATITDQIRTPHAEIPGTLLVLDADGRPDPPALRRRLGDPSDRSGTGAFIAADMVARDGRSLAADPFSARRAALLELVGDGDRFLVSRGLHGEGITLAAAAASMGIDSVSARRLDAPWSPGLSPDAWLRLPVSGVDLGPVRPLLVLLQRLPLD